MFGIFKNRLIGLGALALAVVAGTTIALTNKGEVSSELVAGTTVPSINKTQSYSNLMAATQVRIGAPAPNFTAVDSNGRTHRLTDFRGRIVVMEWTNHECRFVRKHYETNNMQNLQRTATAQGVVWLSVISSAPGQQGFVNGARANELTRSRNAAPTAVLLDPEGRVGRLFGARTTPHMFVIAPNGNLAYMGAIDDRPTTNPEDVATARNFVMPAIEAIRANRPVAIPTTQPYGCSVKYAR